MMIVKDATNSSVTYDRFNKFGVAVGAAVGVYVANIINLRSLQQIKSGSFGCGLNLTVFFFKTVSYIC